jgi:16S rRNA (adenine1518-N6/adenine1519-N6)-dimethyltransferase
LSLQVRAKKHLGQHFLTDKVIAENITLSLHPQNKYNKVLEIGPGMGVLTQFLVKRDDLDIFLIEVDRESIEYLNIHFPTLQNKITFGDFLKANFSEVLKLKKREQFAVIGNFPYNISSQILFKIIEHKQLIPEMVGMFQKEVAERVAAKHGNKTYGILSVICQAFFDIEYLFTVHEHVFSPPPKVKSAVIRITRKENAPDCNESILFKLVKTGFNQRRKTLRNALKPLNLKPGIIEDHILSLRAEQLSVNDFIQLATIIEKSL